MTKQFSRFLAGPLMPASILVLSLIITLIVHAFLHPEKDGRIFFFPDNAGTRIGSERRGIPHRHETAEGISVFLEELILGPETLSLSYTLPRETVVRHVAVVGKTAFVDLNREVLNIDEKLPISFNQALENLRYNVVFNFPGIEELVFTIEGQQVHTPPYIGLDDAE
ncbi:MAG: GerMN domain-containing protein [Spirochaetaceae bacterium]|nr:GerMN domain-containing protein [Spirochaetaceae bacterium]